MAIEIGTKRDTVYLTIEKDVSKNIIYVEYDGIIIGFFDASRGYFQASYVNEGPRAALEEKGIRFINNKIYTYPERNYDN